MTQTTARTVLVTGAAGGIGRALCEAFAANGDRVVAADINADELAKTAAELGCESRAFDITDPDAVATAVSEINTALGPIDVLVNNAGVLHIHGKITELAADDFDKVMKVNIRGTFVVTQVVANHMIEAGTKGVIVNISSIGGRQPTPGMGAYESTKAAVDAITRWAAIELAEHGIRVNAVAPGPVLTPMLKAGMPEGSPGRTMWEQRIPMRKMAEVSEVAATAVFMASPGASQITGTSLAVDGGQLLS